MLYPNLKTENKDLNKILTYLANGNNVFLTGFAGTGKSYLLNELKQIYKQDLVLTSTTGISAVNIQGQTIHSWAKVGCMDVPIKDLIQIFESENFGYYGHAKYRIKKCKILAIDEISMLSAYQIEYLDTLFRSIRRNNMPFGGIQVILIGDFLQLPPVATCDELRNNPRKQLFCFESPVWQNLKLKNVVLTKIYRQENIDFAHMLCNFRLGKILAEDMQYLAKRFVHDESNLNDKLHVFPRKDQAKYFNYCRLQELNTPIEEYKTFDSIPIPDDIEDENEKYKYRQNVRYELNKTCQAEWLIKLKVGCRVMLLVNMDFNNRLINGSCGTVLELGKSYVIVKFDNGITKKITRTSFDLKMNDIIVAKRFQIPLKLAYAITIHKSQGMTFDEIVIDCSSPFAAGQVYVGLSRVRTLEGLYITGFNPKKLYPDTRARQFYIKLEDEEMEKFKDFLYQKYC